MVKFIPYWYGHDTTRRVIGNAYEESSCFFFYLVVSEATLFFMVYNGVTISTFEK